jgi:FKBP-type peptidyl-prolyl cis-trans isomerase (trigger factor)
VPKNLPKYKVEEMARELGMMYPDEIKAFFNNNNQR